MCSLLGAGEHESPVLLTVAGVDGATREVRLIRTVTGPVLPVSQLRVISHLPNRVGYVDLGRPTPHEASAAFDEISDTRAMVFELRRYPRSTGMLVAERLAERPVIGAQLRCPLPTGSLADASPWWHNTMMDRYVKHLIRPRGWRYPGRVVALADSDTISQGEHTALFLEAAASATFIGTPTHGTNGNVASVELADGVSALYTGLDVRHGDRRQLQRVGIEPHVMSGQLSNSSDHCHPEGHELITVSQIHERTR